MSITIQDEPKYVIITNEDDIVLSKDQILENIIQKCKKEANTEDVEIPFTRVPERVSNYTGIPLHVVSKVCSNEYIGQISEISLSSRIEIYKCLRKFYVNKIPPTYDNVYEAVRLCMNIETLEKFINYMTILGYNYYQTSSGVKMLIEDPKVTFERFFYLNKIAEIRKKQVQTIYYIEERVIDLRLQFKKMWLDNLDNIDPSWNGYILLQIISGKKIVHSLFCNQVTEEGFTKWLSEIVLKDLNPHSIIVMDNNKLHGTLRHKTLTKYDTKADILRWLEDNNIPCSSTMRKAELYQLYEKCPKNKKMCNIDRLLKVFGHDVLRLPSALHDLSPMEIFWDNIRSVITSDKAITSNVSDYGLLKLKINIESLMFSINMNKGQQFENDVIGIEKEIYSLDADIENVIDDFL